MPDFKDSVWMKGNQRERQKITEEKSELKLDAEKKKKGRRNFAIFAYEERRKHKLTDFFFLFAFIIL